MLNHLKHILFLLSLLNLKTVLVLGQTSLEIWQIQGSGAVSPYEGKQVTTTPGVVTAIGSGFFFLQSPDEQADQNLETSNGIYVASSQAATWKVGDLLQVRGTVVEFDRHTQIGPANLQVTHLGSDAPMPQPVLLDQNFPSGAPGPLPELEAVEGMLVNFSGISSGPADFRSMVPVVARTQRPFREPGIRFPGLPGLPVWDGNPEIFWLLPNALGQPSNRFIVAQTPITATGIMHQIEREYILFPQEYELGVTPAPRPVRPREMDEITIGSLNARRFEEDADDFSRRARKLSRYIIEMLNAPDILALQEIGSASALSTLRFFIQQLDPQLEYTPFFLAGNDDINLAFLVRTGKFSQTSVRQLGKEETLPGGGILFDRPPLLLTTQLFDRPDLSLQVLNLHLRSLLGIEGGNEGFVREKRFEQSLSVARMIQELRTGNLLLLGDFNAYPFSDGYVDVVNQISGETSMGAQFSTEPIVNPPLHKLADELPAEEAYSFVFEGSAQLIDHALSNELDGLQITGMEFARANADYPDAFAPNELLVESSSDHDAFVIFLRVVAPNSLHTAGLGPISRIYPNPVRAKQALHFVFFRDVRAHIQIVAANGVTVAETLKQKGTQLVSIPIENPGHYYLFVREGKSIHSEKLVVLPTN